MEDVRVDRWLWAVRLCATRTQATAACAAGHVKVNANPAKPSTKVRVGDLVEVRVETWLRSVEVVRVIDTRVGAVIAALCLIDHNPTPPPRAPREAVLRREPGTGRPTKRDRRQLDRLRAE